MKIIRILTACILLCCIMLSMASCSNPEKAVFPGRFDDYVHLFGLNKESVIPKLDPDNRFSTREPYSSTIKFYESPDPVVFHGISFAECFVCYEEDTLLGGIQYEATLNDGSATVAKTVWDLVNHMVKYLGLPPEYGVGNQNVASPLYQKTVEEIETWITEGKGTTSFSLDWSLGALITDASMAYINHFRVNTYNNFPSSTRYNSIQDYPTLSAFLSVKTDGEGAVSITLSYKISYYS